jgi:hypothetical protein
MMEYVLPREDRGQVLVVLAGDVCGIKDRPGVCKRRQYNVKSSYTLLYLLKNFAF